MRSTPPDRARTGGGGNETSNRTVAPSDEQHDQVVLFRMQRRYLAHDLQNGQEVLCSGRLSVYEPRGDYQLIADTVSFRGAGNLAQAFQTLKARLAAEGLFDAAVKRPALHLGGTYLSRLDSATRSQPAIVKV